MYFNIRKTQIIMYDYNFEESLTPKRLTLLLLSLVIPTDRDILVNIYNKKRELEESRPRLYYFNCRLRWMLSSYFLKYIEFQMMLRQIRCLYPGFIRYGVFYTNIHNRVIDTVNIHPLTEITPRPRDVPAPNGISVVNQIFKECVYGETDKNTKFIIHFPNHHIIDETFDEKQKKFMNISCIIEEYGSYGIGDEDIYTSIQELNYDQGISIDAGSSVILF